MIYLKKYILQLKNNIYSKNSEKENEQQKKK
jgi:hypothetical protein